MDGTPRQQIYDFTVSAIAAGGASIYVESFFTAMFAGAGALVVRYAAQLIKITFFKKSDE